MNEQVIDYKTSTNGRFVGVLRWPQFDTLWSALINDASGWYLYAPDEGGPPGEALSAEQMIDFLATTKTYLHERCTKDRCGAVYADSLEEPSFIKIYNPRLMGGCGMGRAPLPQWLISRIKPVSLVD